MTSARGARRDPTLRRRILTLTVGAASGVLVVFLVPLTVLLWAGAVDEVENDAADLAQAIADYASSEPSETELRAFVERLGDRGPRTPAAFVLADGSVIGADLPGIEQVGDETSDGGPDEGGPPPGGPFADIGSADVLDVPGGSLVVVEVAADAGPQWAVVQAPDSEALQDVAGVMAWLLAAAAVVLVVTAAVSQSWTRRLVADLGQTATAADSMAEGHLDTRAPEGGPPEVRRVAQALNGLAGRIGTLLLAERELVADLSHQLRTPLAALRLEVETLARSGHAQAGDLTRLVDQLDRTLTAVIFAARRTEREETDATCRAAVVARDAVEFWLPLAEDQGRSLSLDDASTGGGDDATIVRCSTEDLRTALDALLENCLAHTPEGTAVAVRVAASEGLPGEGDVVLVEVADEGPAPGIPPEAVRRGRSDRGSSGLGLDIARRCAEATGGGLEVDRDAGRTRVRLRLGHPRRAS